MLGAEEQAKHLVETENNIPHVPPAPLSLQHLQHDEDLQELVV